MQVKIEKLDNFGRGIAYLNDKIVFVENALPGEVVEIEIITDKKKYSEALVLNYIKKSQIRIKEECPYSNICGGCNLNHMNYEDENKFKEEKIKSLLTKFSIDTKSIHKIKYKNRNNYRNKIILHGKDNILGLYQKKSNDVVPIDKCLLVNDKINSIISSLKDINKSIKSVTIKTSNDEKMSMISIEGEVTSTDKLLELADVVILNDKLLTKEKEIITSIGNKKYYQSIDSFLQVNKELTKDLYDSVKEEAMRIKPKNVLDLYCGTGTIGIYISEYSDNIIGIDYNESNINDANKNRELNNVDNIEFICDKVENRIDKFTNINLIIVDPPRTGLDSNTKENLKRINAQTIIYVSCDPVTLARDLSHLKEVYNIKYIKPFNMFPRTYHVECVCLLMKK